MPFAARLVTITLVLAATTALSGDASAQRLHKDTDLGYQVGIPKNWDGVPVEIRDKSSGMVAKWAFKRSLRGYAGRIHVYVFDRVKKKPDDDEKTAGDYDRTRIFEQAKTFESWVERHRAGFPDTKPKTRKVKAPKGVKAKGLHYRARWNQGGLDWYTNFLVVTTDENEFVLECYGGGPMEKKLAIEFGRVVKSFKLIKKKEKKGLNARDPSTLTPREEALKRARADAKIPGWWYMESKNYFIVTNMASKRRVLVEQIRKQLEAIRKLYERDFPPTKEITAVSIVRLCKDRKSYYDYGGRPGTGGYWFSVAKELVLFGGDKRLTKDVLNHEAFHQYIYYACGELSPHSWYNEGYGDYYAGAKFAGSKITKHGAFSMRVPTIMKHLKDGTHVPLKDIVRYSQGQYYARPDLCYAEGWSIIYFLNKGITKKHRWRKILPTYLKVLQETQDKDAAVDAAFEGVDFDKLERAWKAFILEKRVARK